MICRYDLRSVQCFTGAGKVRSTVDDSAKIPCTVHRVAPVRSTEVFLVYSVGVPPVSLLPGNQVPGGFTRTGTPRHRVRVPPKTRRVFPGRVLGYRVPG